MLEGDAVMKTATENSPNGDLTDLGSLAVGHFSDRVGEVFQLVAGDGPPVGFELIEVHDFDAGSSSDVPRADASLPAGRPFSLLFRGPPECGLPQGTYRLEHVAFAPLEIFLVPIGPDPAGMRFEAVFN